MIYEFNVIIVEGVAGGQIAFVPALPGCHSQEDTLGELMSDVKEAIELYLEI
jgi:predicted RNase H-like HicB family nuclease